MRLSIFVLIALATVLFVQCGGDDPEVSLARLSADTDANYFPLDKKFHWRYLEEIFNGDNATPTATDTSTYTVRGDTIVDGVTYKAFVDRYGNVSKVVRKEGSKYYGRHHELYGSFAQEYLFLDESAPLNTTWKHFKNDNQTMTEYIVTGVNKDYSLDGVEHHSLIEMTVNYYYLDGTEYKLNYTVLHYYANTIGEVYASYPYPSVVYGDLKVSLLNYGVNQ